MPVFNMDAVYFIASARESNVIRMHEQQGNQAPGPSAGVIDAHQHLWTYNVSEFDWIDDTMGALRRDFTSAELMQVMQTAGVQRTVAVQARQTLQETEFLLAEARSSPAIAGIVGWLPLAQPAELEAALTEYAHHPLLVGARHVVQGEPSGFLEGQAFNDGLRTLTEAGLAYDLLLRRDQLEEASRFVDRHPHQRFVLDHLAKPGIAAGLLEPWRAHVQELAQRRNVLCKLSGMVTEADWSTWTLESLRPYLDTAVEAFGIERLMVGSDWPVCLTATTYQAWWQTMRYYFSHGSADEQKAVFGANAALFYRLAL